MRQVFCSLVAPRMYMGRIMNVQTQDSALKAMESARTSWFVLMDMNMQPFFYLIPVIQT